MIIIITAQKLRSTHATFAKAKGNETVFNDNSHLSFRNLITNSRFFPQKNMESLKHL